MSQSLVKVYVHIIFSTARRERTLPQDGLDRIHAYLATVVNNQGCTCIRVGGMTDHIHVLCDIGSKMCVSDLVKELKTNSSRWIKNTFTTCRSFAWQNGYAAFSVSQSNVDAVKGYIMNQPIHHRGKDFKEELVSICTALGLPYDEKFYWT